MQIDVPIVTWPNHPKRLEYFDRIAAALQKHLTATGHTIAICCSSESQRDPTQPWLGDELAAMCRERNIPLHWRTKPASLGGAMNSAVRLGTGDVVFLVQDDIELQGPLDLAAGAEYLLAHRDVDLIRYSWPGDLTHFLDGNRDGWRRVDVMRGWHYGDDPHLRRRDFESKWGPYMEGGDHGFAEGNMLYRLRAGNAVILASQTCYFGNIGAVSAVPACCEKRDRSVGR